MKTLLSTLRQRKIIDAISSEEAFINLPKERARVYAGFDPSADSLHLGNYFQISVLRRFAQGGVKPIAVVGGATGLVGDPSFRETQRESMSLETLNNNKRKIIEQLESFGFEVFDNLSIYQNFGVLNFLKEVGTKINVSYLLAKESTASRLEKGLSFAEFSYQLLQSYDFLYLYQHKNVFIQIGGSDQWGNMTTGLELIKKSETLESITPVVITTPLLVDSSGQKFGKSVGQPLWLDNKKTPVFKIYQYLLNRSDEEVENLLGWCTFLEIERIQSVLEVHKKNPKIRNAQHCLAYEICKDIFGEVEAQKAQKITRLLFEENSNFKSEDLVLLKEALPTIEFVQKPFIDFLVESGICQSKREVRELLQKGAIFWGDQQIWEENFEMKLTQFGGRGTLLRKGKKHYYLIEKTSW